MAIENNVTSSSSGIKKFFGQNKSLMVLLPLLLVMLVVVAIIYVPKLFNNNSEVPASATNTTKQTQQTGQDSKVEVLPQTQRVIDETAANEADKTNSKTGSPEKDPFVGPISYTGYVLNSNGDNIAVLEGNGRTYLVRIGDMLGENTEVQSITGEEVILKYSDRTTTLKLEQKNNSTTVNK